MKILLFIILFLLLLIFGILPLCLMYFVTRPRLYTAERSISSVKEHGLYEPFDEIKKEALEIASYDNYLLHGLYLKNDSDKFVIITHGWMDNMYISIKYAMLYYRLGFQVIFYDLRHHGSNKRCHVTMGIRESKDLQAIIHYTRNRFGENIFLGIHGESLGAATCILTLREEQNLHFCVADCGYSDLGKLITTAVKTLFHLPVFFIYPANLWCMILYHFSFFSIKPIDVLKENEVPVLFVHGTADRLIPYSMSQEMYDTDKGFKKLVLFEGAEHARSVFSNPKQYLKTLEEFLSEIGGFHSYI